MKVTLQEQPEYNVGSLPVMCSGHGYCAALKECAVLGFVVN